LLYEKFFGHHIAQGLDSGAADLAARLIRHYLAYRGRRTLCGTVAAAIPPLVQEARQLIEQAPHYLQQAQNHSTVIGRLNERFHVQQRITDMIQGRGAPSVGGLVKAGETVFGAVSHLGVVAVLTVYFVADMRRIRATMYRFVPNSRRPRDSHRRRSDGQGR
jgi:predicted PurR-regulated permease PerM